MRCAVVDMLRVATQNYRCTAALVFAARGHLIKPQLFIATSSAEATKEMVNDHVGFHACKQFPYRHLNTMDPSVS